MPKRDNDLNMATRERLLASGEKLFSVRTLDTVSVDDIADDAGVAHGLLFHYFRSKVDFYIVVFERFSDRMYERLHEETRDGTVDQRLRSFLNVLLDLFHERLGSHIYHLRGGAPPKVAAAAEASRQRGVRLVLGFSSDDPPGTTHLLLARAWLALTDELILGWLENQALPRQAIIETCVQLYHAMLDQEKHFQGFEETRDPVSKSPTRSRRKRNLSKRAIPVA